MIDLQQVLALLESNNLAEALTACKELVQKSPADANAQHLLGLLYAKSANLPLALQHFQTAIKLDPKQAIFHNNISNVYKILGDLESSARHLHEALHLEPNNAESYNNLGSLSYTKGDIKTAMQQFEKAIRLNPNSWEAHYNLANCYIKQDMVLQAIHHYQNVLKLRPDHSRAKLNLAMAYVLTKNYPDALPLLEEAANNDLSNAELQGHLAETYLNLGQSDKALSQYLTALTLDENRPAWHHNLGILYVRSGNTNMAKQHFAKALQLQPDNTTAQHMLNALESSDNVKAAPADYVRLLFDQYADYYNEHMRHQLKYTVPQALRQAFGKFINHTTKQQLILDLGCGTGLCAIYFRDLANFLVGVDISPKMLAEAKNLNAYDALCCCNILQTIPGLGASYFDIVLAADVFVYIGDLEPVFALIRSALKVGGKLAFTVEEQNKNNSYILMPSGRFAHSIAYIDQLSTSHGLRIVTNDAIIPRMQADEPIPGRLLILQKDH